jgi:hypothetical protein
MRIVELSRRQRARERMLPCAPVIPGSDWGRRLSALSEVAPSLVTGNQRSPSTNRLSLTSRSS